MSVNHIAPVNYDAVLADLEARLADGQARFDSWEVERKELEGALEIFKKVKARAERQLPLPLSAYQSPAEPSQVPDGTFRGLNYRQAIRRCFDLSRRPMGAPDVTDMLYKAGYSKNRRTIKSNVDSTFSKLRDANLIERTGEGYQYAWVGSNGSDPHTE